MHINCYNGIKSGNLYTDEIITYGENYDGGNTAEVKKEWHLTQID
jgi:hypothetical protein